MNTKNKVLNVVNEEEGKAYIVYNHYQQLYLLLLISIWTFLSLYNYKMIKNKYDHNFYLEDLVKYNIWFI